CRALSTRRRGDLVRRHANRWTAPVRNRAPRAHEDVADSPRASQPDGPGEPRPRGEEQFRRAIDQPLPPAGPGQARREAVARPGPRGVEADAARRARERARENPLGRAEKTPRTLA